MGKRLARSATVIDIEAYYAKLANNQIPTEDEIVSLLKELKHFREGCAYLASCQAATLESLPKSTSKSARGRHVNLCETAAVILDGANPHFRYPADTAAAKERCLRSAERHKGV